MGGMRLLRKGRLICSGEYFGHPNFLSKASLGMLIGEVELTTKVPVLPNKTGFDTSSLMWSEVHDIMHRILEPHIRELQAQREEDTISREEKKRVSQVRRMMIDALQKLDKYGDLTGKFGEDKGRKPPTAKMETKEETDAQNLNEENVATPERQKKPRTTPPEGAVGRLKRLGQMPDWEPRDLDPDIRSAWEEKEGRRCLLINRKYCMYDEWKGDELYIAETAALQLAKPEGDDKLSIEEYLNEVNLLMRAFCEVYNSEK